MSAQNYSNDLSEAVHDVFDVVSLSERPVHFSPKRSNCDVVIRVGAGEAAMRAADSELLHLRAHDVIIRAATGAVEFFRMSPGFRATLFLVALKSTGFMPGSTRFSAPPAPGEDELIATIRNGLLHPTKQFRTLAATSLLWLLAQWNLNTMEQPVESGHSRRILRVVAEMYRRLPMPMSVPEMALFASVSERTLRTGFHTLFSTAPSTFYDRLRVQFATNTLGLRTCTNVEMADTMGFSSPFHFGKWLKQRTGHTPTEFRRRSQQK